MASDLSSAAPAVGQAPRAHPIERARTEASRNPLVAADLCLQGLGATRNHRSEQETAAWLELLAEAVIGASGSSAAEGDPLKAMFDQHACDALACAAMLRLLVLDDSVFHDEPRLRASTGLLDRVLASRVYKAAGITTKDQSFEKRDRLRILVEQHEGALLGHVQSLGSLDGLASFRQQFSKLYKDQMTHVLIRPFLPAGVTSQSFSELFGAAQDVGNAEDPDVLATAETAKERCAALRTAALDTGTAYADELLGALAETLDGLVRSEVKRRGLAEPAGLSLQFHQKRYPLKHKGTSVILRLDLRNEGAGQARDILVSVEGQQALQFNQEQHVMGSLRPGTRRIEFPATVAVPADSEVLIFEASWVNPDGETSKTELMVELQSQQDSLAWEALEYEDPYPLEPVTDATRFVGRKAVLRDLTKIILAGGNARIQGQRRVGKTSIAHAAQEQVERLRPGTYRFLFLDSGDFASNTAAETVARLGQAISSRVRTSDSRLSAIESPDFGPGLSPLTEVFADAEVLAPDRKWVIVLDEFDALSQQELYKHEPIGDSFFQTLRSLGSKPNVAFVLVGGERMKWIIGIQGQVLNRFKLLPVDYFDKDHWGDYEQLVREPVEDWLEIDDSAVHHLHAVSAGNPYFTKLLARELFDQQVANRDLDIRREDIDHAIRAALPKLGAESFQHFWDDAIQGDAADQDYVSAMRRRVLLASASCLREQVALTANAIVKRARAFNVDEATAHDVIRGFVERQILLEDSQGYLSFRVPLFEQWLPEHGMNDIVVSMGDDDALIQRQRKQEAARPKGAELKELADRWRTYAGQLVDPDRIRAWLNQFGQPSEQRLMLQLLQALRYYNAASTRDRLRNLHSYVLRELASAGYEYKLSGRQRVRNDLLLTGLEGGGSGAAHLVKPYRDENKVYAGNAVDAAQVPDVLRHRSIRAVVVLEDFIATGETAASRIRQLHEAWTEAAPWPEDTDVFLLAIAGFESGLNSVRASVMSINWPVQIYAADLLDDQDRCFGEQSIVFPDENERHQAQALCAEKGNTLEPKHPLGYNDSRAAVCFEARCPNNSLPVLWKDGPSWTALFPRL